MGEAPPQSRRVMMVGVMVMMVVIIVWLFRHRIIPALVEGCATGDTLGAHPAPFDDAKSLNRLIGVIRTGRGVDATAPQHWRNKYLVKANELKKDQLGQIEDELHDACLASGRPG